MKNNCTKALSLSALFLLLPFVTAFSSDTADISIKGEWRGTVVEDGRSYSLSMNIERLELGAYAGTTTYSDSLNCGGLLTLERRKSCIYVFKEVISKGSDCASGGRIEVWRTEDGYLQWEWYRPGEWNPEATSILSQR